VEAEISLTCHESPLLDPILTQLILTPASLRLILILSSHPRPVFRSGLFASRILATCYMHFSFLVACMCVERPAHPIFLELIALTVTGEEYNNILNRHYSVSLFIY